MYSNIQETDVLSVSVLVFSMNMPTAGSPAALKHCLVILCITNTKLTERASTCYIVGHPDHTVKLLFSQTEIQRQDARV